MRKKLEQTWLIDRINALGYSSGLICFGFAHMAMQAMLANDMETYNQRMQMLYDVPLEEFHNQNITHTHAQVLNALQSRLKKSKISEEEQRKILDSIPAYFEGILLYHGSTAYKDFFSPETSVYDQEAPLTIPLVQSLSLEDKGGIEQLEIMSGNYLSSAQNDELLQYFVVLRSHLHPLSLAVKHPIPLCLSGRGHAITVGYDAKENTWLLCDADDAFTKKLQKDFDIAEAVRDSLGDGYLQESLKKDNLVSTIFSTFFYSTRNEIEQFQTALRILKNDKTWIKLHTITRLKPNTYDNGKKVSLLEEASIVGQLQIVSEILEMLKVEPLLCIDKLKISKVLNLAAFHGHKKVIEMLQEHGATLLINRYTVDLLMELTSNGDVEIIQILLRPKQREPDIHNKKDSQALKDALENTPKEQAVLWSTLYCINPGMLNDDNRALLANHKIEDLKSLSGFLYTLFLINPRFINDANFKLMTQTSSLRLWCDMFCTVGNSHPQLITEANLNRLLNLQGLVPSKSWAYEFSSLFRCLVEIAPERLTVDTFNVLVENVAHLDYYINLHLRKFKRNHGAITQQTLEGFLALSKQRLLEKPCDWEPYVCPLDNLNHASIHKSSPVSTSAHIVSEESGTENPRNPTPISDFNHRDIVWLKKDVSPKKKKWWCCLFSKGPEIKSNSEVNEYESQPFKKE